ncbi:thiamine phosphate synthase [Paenibacillus tuaregi]|uniref:thiamine phosphate synthase n=1 Tax=Paenibacillus tuaregi TaxID=1816681 RepID=UPI000B2A287F|nr:thiamine phosphate synthase [Paenibacillus tuaregi]
MNGLPKFHVISDGTKDVPELVRYAIAIHPYLDAFHLREKSWSAYKLSYAVEQLLEAGMPAGKLYINDRADIAKAYKLGGVQLGGESLSPIRARTVVGSRTMIGRSIHNAEELREAAGQGADYCIYGHIYPTSSKQGLTARGLHQLANLCGPSAIPVIAIGGITPGRVSEVLQAGVDGIAVMSGVMGSPDPAGAAGQYQQALLKETIGGLLREELERK